MDKKCVSQYHSVNGYEKTNFFSDTTSYLESTSRTIDLPGKKQPQNLKTFFFLFFFFLALHSIGFQIPRPKNVKIKITYFYKCNLRKQKGMFLACRIYIYSRLLSLSNNSMNWMILEKPG